MSLKPVVAAAGRRRSAAPSRLPRIASGRRREDAVASAEGRRGAAAGKHPLPRGRGRKRSRHFAKQLAALGDIFVNDAFSAAHRAHATTEGVAHLLPIAAGRSMEAELTHLQKALGNPERPLMAVVGGAKVSTKIALLENLVKRVEALVIGGAMANTFLAAEGIAVGKSLYEADHLETARRVMHMATESGAAILLPTDVVVAKEFKAERRRTAPCRSARSAPTR